MSEKYDAYKQVRVDPENVRKLAALKRKLPVKSTFCALANACITRGIQEIEATTLTTMKALK